jgi:hypothetical protein
VKEIAKDQPTATVQNNTSTPPPPPPPLPQPQPLAGPSSQFIQRMLNLNEQISQACTRREITLVEQVCNLVGPFSFIDNKLLKFDLFSLETSVIENLERLFTTTNTIKNDSKQTNSSKSTPQTNGKQTISKNSGVIN